MPCILGTTIVVIHYHHIYCHWHLSSCIHNHSLTILNRKTLCIRGTFNLHWHLSSRRIWFGNFTKQGIYDKTTEHRLKRSRWRYIWLNFSYPVISGVPKGGIRGPDPHSPKMRPSRFFQNPYRIFQEWRFPAFARVWRACSENVFLRFRP